MSSSNCCFLTCTQVSQEAGQVVWYSHLFQNFPQFIMIHTVKGFGIVKKAEIDVFLELSCFFDDPANVGNLISGSSAFSKTNLNIWKFTVHILLKTGLENFERYITSVWDECNCAIVWAFFSIAFLWDWNENWPFPVLWPLQRLGYIKTMTSILFSPPAPNSEGSKLQGTMLWITLGDRNLWPTGSKELSPPETTGLSLNTHSPAQSRLNMTAAPDNSLTTDSARTTPISGS